MFRQIPDFPFYEVNEIGVVKTKFRRNGKTYCKPYKDRDGYLRVALYKSKNERVWIGVHKLVAIAFLGGDHGGMVVNHINYKRDDNRVENLEWVTPKQNAQHSSENYKHTTNNKPVIAIAKDGRTVEYESISSAARSVGGNAANIHRSIHTGYSHAGFVWHYR